MTDKVNFVVASHRPEVLHANLLKSDAFKTRTPVVMTGYGNVAKAYNEAGVYGLTCYVHHDVYLPPSFEGNLMSSIEAVNAVDPNWGVLGVAGVTKSREFYGALWDRDHNWNGSRSLPHEVETLDELLLVTRGDFVFDEEIPGNHFYGADICLQAARAGRKNYAISAYVCHNSTLGHGERPPDFYAARDYIKAKYGDMLPIVTTCTVIL